MTSRTQPVFRHAPRARRQAGAPAALCVGLLLALPANEACAAALGSLATSVGLFAALVALFVIKGWPAHLLAVSAIPTAGGALVVAGGAAWWWRARFGVRAASFAPGTGISEQRVSRAAGPAQGAGVMLLPAGVDPETLLVELRLHFVRLQEAWDLGAMPALQALTTPEMLAELRSGLSGCAGENPAPTDVVTLRAELFDFEDLGETFLISVEFSGLMREAAGQGASPFKELWLLTRSKEGAASWKLARHQTLI